MKTFIPILFIATVALAEPPVGDGYAAARSHDDHDHEHHEHDHQRSLSQEYGPPSDNFESARNTHSDGYDYNTPNARRANARQSRYPPATVRVSFNQRFSSAATRKSVSARRQEHSVPTSRSGISQDYGPPVARSLSQEYGAPSVMSARTLSTEYGMPDARSNPSQEYGAPIVGARSNQQSRSQSDFHSGQPSKSHDHSSPLQIQSDSVSVKSASSRDNDVPESYEPPQSSFGTRTAPSSSYGTPSSRSLTPNSISSARSLRSQDVDTILQTYGAPSLDARSLSQEYGVPSSHSNLMTSAVPSSFASIGSRSSPASNYLPVSRSAAPTEEYGVPEQRDSSAQGYDYARARALEELQNQEPASYDFGYQIEDQESGSDFGHTETREADRAQGSYFVVRPDGSKQIVEYEADERGFKPRISVEPADAASARAGGYDDNAQDSSLHGPY